MGAVSILSIEDKKKGLNRIRSSNSIYRANNLGFRTVISMISSEGEFRFRHTRKSLKENIEICLGISPPERISPIIDRITQRYNSR